MGAVFFIFILDDREIGMNFYAYKSIMAVIDVPFGLAIEPLLKKKSYKSCYNIFYFMCVLSGVLLVSVKIMDSYSVLLQSVLDNLAGVKACF